MTKQHDRVRNLYDALSESVVQATDSEILDECRESGESPEKIASHMRQLLRQAWNNHQRRPERETYLRAASLAQKSTSNVPDTAEERRTLLRKILSKNSEIARSIIPHIDQVEKMTDEDVQLCLEQFEDLGLLSSLKESTE